jgi:hypothetical protein
VQVARSARGERTGTTFHRERLVSAAERDRQREHWAAAMARVEAALGG